MKVYEYGDKNKPVLILLPGTCCHWKCNFGHVIEELQRHFKGKLLQKRMKKRMEENGEYGKAMNRVVGGGNNRFEPCYEAKHRKPILFRPCDSVARAY